MKPLETEKILILLHFISINMNISFIKIICKKALKTHFCNMPTLYFDFKKS